MRHIQLIWRKATKGDKWFQWLIALYTKALPPNWGTKGLYCHTEIRFIERKECFSAANKGKFVGVRFDKTENVIKDLSKWDGFTVQLALDEEIKLYDACKRKEGIKYDWLAIFGFALPVGIEDKDRHYCSEICADRMHEAGLYPKRHRIISPLRWSKLASEHFQLKPIPFPLIQF